MENNIGKRIKELADAKGVTIAHVERKVGLSNGQLAKWKSRAPRIDKANEVANYLGVSLDYIYGNEPKPIDKEIQSVIYDMERMTKKERQKAQDIIEVLGRK
ncbi:helix-turn-helix transcriptional regulator [Staphylococcus saprophyticus]|uniref:helix-turn-helix domain-containing protein n=1 Tax=Staphylococcus equorum TaxID=246432 RepID=UPI0008FB9AE7|nr:helix-turn-helix transcriptional regulator [Staphylococcus equorum]MDW3926450.1 helix-turn-helix transcriptional regulator [Staphylococcus saprophyticus]MDW4219838.1 helix-turn-helix transcriptional regulator [Staphylococcus saprophyticus]MDW4338246.1 helix-turn-helix transcriptional regulator [Staphylococcus saprophyticus]OIS50203.1 hypothetical protein A4A29_02285 [Staphylococcus equorum]